jgi:hypothetical protein
MGDREAPSGTAKQDAAAGVKIGEPAGKDHPAQDEQVLARAGGASHDTDR